MREKKKRERAYPSDLTDTQWEEIKPLFLGMREYTWSKRELIDAVMYFVKTGCQWRHLRDNSVAIAEIPAHSPGRCTFSLKGKYFTIGVNFDRNTLNGIYIHILSTGQQCLHIYANIDMNYE